MTRRRWIIALGAAALVLFWTAGALWILLQAMVPPLHGREPLPGLGDSVVVYWDSLAVPHIVAKSEDDLFAAVGYLHARDRGWEMDLLRHAAEGRLSELFGPRTVAIDRAMREREMPGIARRRLAAAAPETHRILDAYARGVNAWFATGDRALEFRLLRHSPEPWRPEHSLEIGILEAWELHSDGDELGLAAAVRDLGAARAADLFPHYPDSGPVILSHWETRKGARLAGRRDGHGALAWAPQPPARPAASNAWVVGPRWTASRKPILANDPHLTLRAPSIWYLAGEHAPGLDVVGTTIPGLPMVILGHTARLGWGFTNAMVDDVDYVVEQLSGDSSTVRRPGGWEPVEIVAETIAVRGAASVVYSRRRTPAGPVVTLPDWRADSAGRVLAMRWAAQDTASDEVAALVGMARAPGLDAFTAAVARFRSPEQNVVYGDSAGNIAYFLAGHVPVRVAGDGSHPVAGWTAADPWDGFVPAAELPHAVNPPDGAIVTANNRIVRGDQPFVSHVYELPWRATRIWEMVRADSLATAASTAAHQLDRVDVFARNARAAIATAAEDAGHADLATALRAWDGTMAPDRVEPTVAWSWYRWMRRLVYAHRSPGYEPGEPLQRWILVGQSRWFSGGLRDVARAAMDSALAHGAAAPWGRRHVTVMSHPLGSIPVIGRLFRFNVGPFANGGDNNTVNVAISSDDTPPYVSDYGPSMRHVVDFGDVDGAGGFILPTGQSGHPFSAHYRDQTDRWRQGGLWRLPVDIARVSAVDTLRLIPAPR